MEFIWPLALLFLPLPWLAARFLSAANPARGDILNVPFADQFKGVATPGASHLSPRQRKIVYCAWALLVIATARPVWLAEPGSVPVSGRDLVLAVDISASMNFPDLDTEMGQQSRLDHVKAAAGRFIDDRKGDRIGLILFATRAGLASPLTYDRAAVKNILVEAKIGEVGRESAIGDAIAQAIKMLQSQPQDNRVLILMTDGASNSGLIMPLDAASRAVGESVRIYTVGIGGGPIRARTKDGIEKIDPSESLDEALLTDIARITGGLYFRVENSDGLQEVYRQLDLIEPTPGEVAGVRQRIAMFMWPLALALLLSVFLVAARLELIRSGRAT